METLDIVKAAVAALEDKKAEDVTVIDIRLLIISLLQMVATRIS